MRLYITGNDERSAALKQRALEKGHVITENAPDAVILPLPRAGIRDMKRYYAHGQKIIGGKTDAALGELIEKEKWQFLNVLEDEKFLLENARLTAEGAVWKAMNARKKALCYSRCMVVGYGRIGKAIAKLFSCFTDKISVVSKHLTDEEAASDGVKKVTLEEAFRTSEVIILAGGNTPSTYRMIGEKEFALMQKDALFVNIARGKMVDEEAMIRAAAEKEIFLALDVFETEPLPEDSPLRNKENILITPHRANNSIEFEERWKCLAKDMIALAQGKTPDSVLTEERASAMSES